MGWANTKDGRIEIDPRIIARMILEGARTIAVEDVQGAGVCSAIPFGRRGELAPEDRDAAVSPELKEAVLVRDGCCVVCGARENLGPHHLDSHADGGKSDMRRLIALCLRCQGSVHDQDVILRVEEDGTVTALDRDGRVIGKPQSAAEVLAEADESCPLETIERRVPPAPEAEAEAGGAAGPEAAGEGEAPRSLDSIEDLPSELTASQWRALQSQIEWSPTHRAFLFRPDGRDLAEFLKVSGTCPPVGASGPAAAPSGTESLADFVGQRRAVENLLLAARAAKGRGEAMGHTLLSGQAGLGKTTAARLLARECGAPLVEVLAGNIHDPNQLISLLCRLQEGEFILIDEIHRLEAACQESLYTALEDNVTDVVLREGGRTRALRVRLEPFTLVGATTCLGKLTPPLRSRFRLLERLEPYNEEELAGVVEKAAGRIGITVSPDAAREVARRSKGTPREAIRILGRARDVAQLAGAQEVIALAHVVQAAERLGIDERGLDPVDREVVTLLLRRGKATGSETIALRIGLDVETYKDVHEPWLERSGLLERTRDGRVATEEARKLYGARVKSGA